MQSTCTNIAPPDISRPVTRIEGDVDPSTGNIAAAGDLHIRGNVVDLFQVQCAGDAMVEGVIEAAAVSVGRDLHANGGISGKRKGYCQIGQNLRARYITNSTIECAGDVWVETEISTSRIACGADLKIENGLLVGGHTIVAGSLHCQSLGTPAGVSTLIEVGIDDSLRRLAATSLPEIERCKQQAEQIRTRLAPLLKIRKNLNSQQKEKVTEMLFEADDLESRANDLLESLRLRWKAHASRPDPEVKIADVLFPGTTVRFARMELTVDAALKGPLRLAARASAGQRYISLFQDGHQTGYPLPTRPSQDAVWENLLRAMQQPEQAGNLP